MKVMLRIVVYLVVTFVLMFVLTSVVLAAVSILSPEMMEKGATPLAILGSMYLLSLIAYGVVRRKTCLLYGAMDSSFS